MKKYIWLADLAAQTVFSITFTLLSVGLNERKTKTGAFAPVFAWTKEVFRT